LEVIAVAELSLLEGQKIQAGVESSVWEMETDFQNHSLEVVASLQCP
jgi:hypothetical protein